MRPSRDDRLFALGVALWIAVLAVTWPCALSFGDEVGYVGRAKLLLDGHLGHLAHSPGIWIAAPDGILAKYPLPFSALIAPLVALTPRAVFALGVASAVALALTARAVLKSWGKSPCWALLVLAHPTIVILARTAMADLPQAAAALGAWWACRRGRGAAVFACFALLVSIKATGAVLAVGILGGQALASLAALRARDAATLRCLGLGAAGAALGHAAVLATNHLAAGTFASGYDAVFQTIRPFALANLTARAPVYLAMLLLNPPLLVAGAWTYWRRREPAPLLVSGGFLAMMSVYFFVDRGTTWVESMVLAPRLALPVVAFLLVGYGAWLDDVVARVAPSRAATPPGGPAPLWLGVALVVLPLAVAGAVSVRHSRFQDPAGEVLAAAARLADARAERTLGLTDSATKAGLLFAGRTTLYDPKSNRTAVVLCGEASASYRAAAAAPHGSCALPGYHAVAARDGFVALLRDDVAAP